MKNNSYRRELFLLLTCFVLSRICIKLAGVTFGYDALFNYWQYLDVKTLQHQLLSGLWFQHAQPPVFNGLLGIVLKCSGRHAPVVFELLFLIISFCNGCLLLRILKKLTTSRYLPLIVSLLFLLSPATMLFENELFYTTFISMLLLGTVYFLSNLTPGSTWVQTGALFCCLTLLSLTKGLYHLAWLGMVTGIILIFFRGTKVFARLLVCAALSLLIVTGWYVKNALIFGSFSASSWTGMNLARIVFHEIPVKDPANIASIPPFYPIIYYKGHISSAYTKTYAGLNDQALLAEQKNDSANNLNNAGYLEVSRKYTRASIDFIVHQPSTYCMHVAKSFLIFFTPASSYFRVLTNAGKIRYYDMVYSFNLSHFVHSEEGRKRSLALSAIPKFWLYLFVFFRVIKDAVKRRHWSAINGFAACTILFVLVTGTLFEYGEDMRFRYEVEPLFLILASQVLFRKQVTRPVQKTV